MPVCLKGWTNNFKKNLGNTKLASSVARDSHNIIAVGVDGEAKCQVINAVIADFKKLPASKLFSRWVSVQLVLIVWFFD